MYRWHASGLLLASWRLLYAVSFFEMTNKALMILGSASLLENSKKIAHQFRRKFQESLGAFTHVWVELSGKLISQVYICFPRSFILFSQGKQVSFTLLQARPRWTCTIPVQCLRALPLVEGLVRTGWDEKFPAGTCTLFTSFRYVERHFNAIFFLFRFSVLSYCSSIAIFFVIKNLLHFCVIVFEVFWRSSATELSFVSRTETGLTLLRRSPKCIKKVLFLIGFSSLIGYKVGGLSGVVLGIRPWSGQRRWNFRATIASLDSSKDIRRCIKRYPNAG